MTLTLFFKKWKRILVDREMDVKKRTFCWVATLTMVFASIALAESAFVGDSVVVVVCMGVLFASAACSIAFILLWDKDQTASYLMGVALCGITIPTIFFFNGGIEGGATVWFSLGIIYLMLMFEGLQMYVSLVLAVCVYVASYVLAYLYPALVHPLNSKMAIFADSLFSVISVGVAAGIMARVYILGNTSQRNVVLKQKEELEKASSSQNAFFKSMSSELKTPVHNIIESGELISRYTDDEDALGYVDRIHAASKALLSKIDDVLDMSQLEGNQLELANDNYDLMDVFKEIHYMVRNHVKAPKIVFRVDVDEHVPRYLRGDVRRIKQILITLLASAIDCTPEGNITLRVTFNQLKADKITLKFSVEDSGNGIRKDEFDALYSMVEASTSDGKENIQGSGLKFAVAKRLVDQMGGEFFVDSIYTKGATFSFVIPQEVAEERGIGDVVKELQYLNKTRAIYEHLFEAPNASVLVVDSNQESNLLIQDLLEETKVHVDMAISFAECLEKTQQTLYQLILMADQMYEMDGTNLIREIRRQENGLCHNTSVIAMTSAGRKDAKAHFEKLDFDDYIEKPFSGEALEEKVYDYISPELVEFYAHKDEEQNFKMQKLVTTRKKKIKITTDCVADINADDLAMMDVSTMYLYIRTEQGRFADTIEIDSDNLAQYRVDNHYSATADSVSVEEFEAFFAEQLTQAEEVIHISLGKNCGASYAVAMEASKNFDHVHVIDSCNIACGQNMLVLYAARLVREGHSARYVIDTLEATKKMICTYFIMSSADTFYQSGRGGILLMKLCHNLHLHPVLAAREEGLRPVGFMFGNMRRCRAEFVRRALRHRNVDRSALFFTHVAIGTNELDDIVEYSKKKGRIGNVFVNKASFSVACSSGVGSLAVAYYKTKERGII